MELVRANRVTLTILKPEMWSQQIPAADQVAAITRLIINAAMFIYGSAMVMELSSRTSEIIRGGQDDWSLILIHHNIIRA